MKFFGWLLSNIILILVVLALTYTYVYWDKPTANDTPLGGAMTWMEDRSDTVSSLFAYIGQGKDQRGFASTAVAEVTLESESGTERVSRLENEANITDLQSGTVSDVAAADVAAVNDAAVNTGAANTGAANTGAVVADAATTSTEVKEISPADSISDKGAEAVLSKVTSTVSQFVGVEPSENNAGTEVGIDDVEQDDVEQDDLEQKVENVVEEIASAGIDVKETTEGIVEKAVEGAVETEAVEIGTTKLVDSEVDIVPAVTEKGIEVVENVVAGNAAAGNEAAGTSTKANAESAAIEGSVVEGSAIEGSAIEDSNTAPTTSVWGVDDKKESDEIIADNASAKVAGHEAAKSVVANVAAPSFDNAHQDSATKQQETLAVNQSEMDQSVHASQGNQSNEVSEGTKAEGDEKYVTPELVRSLSVVPAAGAVAQQIETEQQAAPTLEELWVAARRAFHRRDYEGAVESYEALIVQNADEFDAYGELGNVYYYQGDTSMAAAYYLDAAEVMVKLGQVDRAASLQRLLDRMDRTKADELRAIISSARQQ